MRLRHSVPPVQYIQKIVGAGCCPVVVAQGQSTGCPSQVSWVRFPETAGLFTFLYGVPTDHFGTVAMHVSHLVDSLYNYALCTRNVRLQEFEVIGLTGAHKNGWLE